MDQPRSLGPPPRPAWDPEPPPPTGRIGVDKANGRVTFPDGHIYTFQDHSLLTTAISYRNWGLGRPPNQPLALYGDTIIRAILCHRWITHSGDIRVWQEIESRGIGTNFFLSTQGWEMGLDLVMYAHQLLANITLTEMATTMEAIVGAVARDCAGEAVVVSRVMRSLGLFWPETDAEMAYLRSRLSILRALRVLPSGENGSYQ